MHDQDTDRARFVFLAADGTAYSYDGLCRQPTENLGQWKQVPIGERFCVFIELRRLRYVAVLDWPPSSERNGIVALMKPETYRRRATGAAAANS